MKNTLKVGVVLLAATILSTLAIKASDYLDGRTSSLLGLVNESTNLCGAGAVQLNLAVGSLCVDQYEASPSSDCPALVVDSALTTQTNLNNPDCSGLSVSGAEPWRFVSLTQAKQLCARSGKRLPTAAEWYAVAVALPDLSKCVLDAVAPAPTGKSACTTSTHIFDLVGNVWEWVDEEVREGKWNERALPSTGYVGLVDQAGIVIETADVPIAEYGADYAKTDAVGIYGMIRGGFYGSKSDGGLFAQNLAVPLDLKTDGVGFRCVRGIN